MDSVHASSVDNAVCTLSHTMAGSPGSFKIDLRGQLGNWGFFYSTETYGGRRKNKIEIFILI